MPVSGASQKQLWVVLVRMGLLRSAPPPAASAPPATSAAEAGGTSEGRVLDGDSMLFAEVRPPPRTYSYLAQLRRSPLAPPPLDATPPPALPG